MENLQYQLANQLPYNAKTLADLRKQYATIKNAVPFDGQSVDNLRHLIDHIEQKLTWEAFRDGSLLEKLRSPLFREWRQRSMLLAAADEIERLNKEVARLTSLPSS